MFGWCLYGVKARLENKKFAEETARVGSFLFVEEMFRKENEMKFLLAILK